MGDVQHDHPTDVRRHESLVRHPMHAIEEEAEHLREVVDEGKSVTTPAIMAGALLLFVVPLAALIILLVFVIAHFA